MIKDTIIVVGVTRIDGYGNLWVTPKGSGDEVKIGAKRSQLHELFQQDKAILLHWETYKNRPYVSDAKLVEGELPPSEPSDRLLPEDQRIIDEVTRIKPAPQEIGMWWNNLGNRIGDGSLERDYPKSVVKIKSQYYSQMFKILGIEEVKGETTKAQTIQEIAPIKQPEVDETVVEDKNEPKTISEFLNHLKGMGIKAPRTWLAKEWEVPITEVLTFPKCLELYGKIQKTKRLQVLDYKEIEPIR